MNYKFELKGSRRFCSLDKFKIPIFFSLVDYRNNYFTSDDPKKIIEFYNGFENRDQLIQWMKERPKGVANIHEVNGDKDVIVVITTSDFNGKYAKECRENIFKGLHMVFVESAEIPDPYFSDGHNFNVGIKKAMEYNPKWVVVSTEDMVKIDSADTLKHQLLALDNKKYDAVFTKPSNYHSSPERISQRNLLYDIYCRVTNKNYGRASLKMFNKFEIKYFISPILGKYSRLFKEGYQFLEIQDFGIYSSEWISRMNGEVHDEIFISAAEDTDISLRLSFNRNPIAIIDYKIGDSPPGFFLGNGTQRGLRTIAGLTYLNYKWKDILDREERERR